jgi:predicted ATPase
MIGREAELASVAELLRAHRLVTITGAGGVGKSTLARTAAQQDGRSVLRADVASLRGDDLREELVGCLGFASWDALLSDDGLGPMLIFLDDCERFAGPIADLVLELLEQRPDAAVLATSREPLDLPDERVFVLRPLSLEGQPSEAAQLFVTYATARGQRPPERWDDVESLCRSLDGLPLAIELAAGRASVLTPSEIRESVETRLDLLSRARPRSDDRWSSLDATIAWSVDLLDDTARSVLEAVSVCAGPFTLGLAAHVGGLPSPAHAVPVLQSLVTRSLVVHEPARDTSWFRLLNTIRTHCRSRLATSGRLGATRERFVDAIAVLCDRLADPVVHMQDPRTPDEVRRSYRNIAAALTWCIENDRTPERAARMLMPLFWLEDVGYQSEAAELVTRLLQRWPDAGSTAWGVLSNLNRAANRTTAARSAATRALDGDGFGAALAHRTLGILDRQAGKQEQAIEHFSAAADAAQAAGLRAHVLELDGHRALAMFAMGDVDAAAELLAELEDESQQYALCRRCIRLFESQVLVGVDSARAATLASQVLADARRHEHTWAVGTAAYQVALASLLNDDLATAAEHSAQALLAYDAAHEVVELRQALMLAAAVLERKGATDDAVLALAAAGRLPARALSASDRELLARLGVDPDTSPPLVGEYSLEQTCRALRTEPSGGTAQADQPLVEQDEAPVSAFIRQGDVWKVSYAGRTAFARHTKGMSDIAALLSRPGHEVSAMDLIGAGAVVAGTGPILDERARAEYQVRIRELQAEVDDADQANDPYRAERATLELDALVDELSSAYGLGGRSRATGGETAERARTAVTWRIRAAIDRLQSSHPELADHLRRSVQTGRFCRYEPSAEVSWKL